MGINYMVSLAAYSGVLSSFIVVTFPRVGNSVDFWREA